MFFRILKNDLRRQPVTNIILFLFITLAVTFAAAGVNNIVTVLSAQSDFYTMAGVTDYYAITNFGDDGTALDEAAQKFQSISSYTCDPLLFLGTSNFKTENGEDADVLNSIALCAADRCATTFFAQDDRTLVTPAEGELWVSQKLINTGLLVQGETVTVTVGATALELTVTEVIKDALFGADGMGMYRVLVSEEDFDALNADDAAAALRSALFGFAADDTGTLSAELSETEQSMLSQFSGEMLNMLNYLNLSIAALLALFSACLIVLFLVILRYTIRFTLNQEFRDIGVMKAVGLTDRRIGNLYLIKYFAMAALGAVLGFVLSIPFGDLLLRTLSSSMVIANRDPFGINLVCAAAVLLLVLLFCRRCVRMLQHFSPADAVRSGSVGESRGGKHRFSLGKSRMRPNTFLPLNDILSGVKQYLVMGLAFTVCLLLVLVLADTVNTMGSGSVFTMFGLKQSDAVLMPEYNQEEIISAFDDTIAYHFDEIEEKLRENGISAQVFYDYGYSGRLVKDSRSTDLTVMAGYGATADEYTYLEGSAPTGENEIALTRQTAELLDVAIGDIVTLCFGMEKKEYLLTGYFQSMMNMGNGARVSRSDFISGQPCSTIFGYQILFDDTPSERELDGELDRLRELFPDCKVYDAVGFIETLIGDISATLQTVRNILAPILLVICALVAVLMELSFIEKEKGELAMLKAVGFRNGFLIRRHLVRTGITALLSILIAELLSEPVAQVTAGIAFRMMGATKVEFVVRPTENFVYWPCAILAVILAAVFFTALKMNHITARDTAGIE